VFAVTAGAFVPVNFIAVRLAENLVHPRVLNATAGDMPGEMRLTFLVSLLAISLLYLTLMKLELSSKHARAQLKRLRTLLEAEPPAGAAATPLATVPARPTYD
jgi:heme exporter protein C